MAVNSATNTFHKWNIQHFKRLAKYNSSIEKLLNQAITSAADIVSRRGITSSDTPFAFDSDRQMNAEADKILKDLTSEITAYMQSAEGEEWKKAYNETAEYISDIYKTAFQTKYLQDKYADTMLSMRSRNLDALEAFKQRKIGGLKLSDKVWECTSDFKSQLEVSIDTALMTGKSADKLALSIMDLLKEPDALFRRVRDENDELRMSKAMEAYHPGSGRYRSAYKNAMRLARSEINMAYRASDSETAQMLDCIVGIQVNLSNNHTCNGVPLTDICDQLQGKYPKDFKFVGWHPQCRCFITYILKTDEEFWNDLENGENNDSVNSVDDVPDNFKKWVGDNEQRIANAEQNGTLPYFLRDNKNYMYEAQQQLNKRITFQELRSISSWDVECSDSLMDNKQIERWFENTPYSNLDISMFNMQLNDTFQQYGIDVGNITKRIILNPYDNSMEMQVLFEHNGQVAKIIRDFSYNGRNDTLNVEHSLFKIPYDLQGKGFSRSILSAYYEQYKKIGVDKIKLFANINVGGYAWARYGFSCTEGKEGVIHVISSSESKSHIKFTDALGIVEDFYKTHSVDEPFPMQLLTQHEWSKDLLLGTDWVGSLRLSDKKQVKVFEEYLYH